jgi:uncharacterized lipoprotein NlpE involved in copper resistance
VSIQQVGKKDHGVFGIATAVVPIGGVVEDAAPDVVAEGEVGGARITPPRAVHVNLRNQSGAEMGTLANPIRTDPVGGSAQVIEGDKANNGGPPGSDNLGVLPAVATAAAPAYTEGRQVGLSVTLAGTLRVTAVGGASTVDQGTGGLSAWKVDGSGVTQPISAAALPLPSGAATEATLATRASEATLGTRASEATLATRASEATLASVDGKLNSLGQKAMAGSVPVAIASDQSAVPVSGTFFQATQPVSVASLPLPSGASTEATLALIKAKTDNLDVALSTRTKPADTQLVSAASLPLPSGAATEATLALIKAKTDNIDVALSTRTKPADIQQVDGSGVIQPISAASLPLPAGAATAARQDTGNASLANIDADLDVALSTRASEATLSTRATEATLATRATEATLASVDGKLNSLGQKAMAASVPVVIASDQSAVAVDGSAVTQPVSGTVTAEKGGDWPVQGVDEADATVFNTVVAVASEPGALDVGLVVRDIEAARARRLQESMLLEAIAARMSLLNPHRGFEIRGRV